MSTKYFIAFIACFSIMMVTACGSSSSNPDNTSKAKTVDQEDGTETNTTGTSTDGTTTTGTNGDGTTGYSGTPVYGGTVDDGAVVGGPVFGGTVIVTPRRRIRECNIELADPCRRYRRRTGRPAVCMLYNDSYIGECVEVAPPIHY